MPPGELEHPATQPADDDLDAVFVPVVRQHAQGGGQPDGWAGIIRVFEQGFQQAFFIPRQRNPDLLRPHQNAGFRVDQPVAADVLLRYAVGSRAEQTMSQVVEDRGELQGIDGFDQIGVGTCFEPGDAFMVQAAGGDEDDPDGHFVRAQIPAGRESILSLQTDIEYQQGSWAHGQVTVACLYAVERLDVEPEVFQLECELLTEDRFVLDDGNGVGRLGHGVTRLNENLIWNIGLVDVHTLALGAGLGKLVFLSLAWIYGRSVASTDGSLRVWQGSCLASGLAFLLIWLRPVAPLWLSLTVANLLLMLAWAMEYHAYQRLLGGGLRALALTLITGVAGMVRVLLHAAAVPLTGVLLYTSLVYGGYFALMAVLLIAHRCRGELTLLIGVTNAIIAALFLARFISLLWPYPPDMPSVESIHLILWISGFLITFVNGFGFLLLVKQEDDRKLREALEDVSLAEAEQRQLLSLASHEFRTPAAIIQSSLDSLKFLAAEITPAVAARHDNMHRATQRLIHLANALITQDRLRDLSFELMRRDVDLAAVTGEIVGRYTQPLRWDPPPVPVPASVDPELIAIALYNLIDNALRHSPAGQPPEVRLRQTSDGVEWQVADHGPGVPDADKQAIFERFYRKDTGLGSGLGLSIVRRIARLHGGEASLQDHSPHGACFVIHLPGTGQSA